MDPARALYTAGLVAATPFVAGYLLWRSRRQPDYRLHWDERWAAYREPTGGDDAARPDLPWSTDDARPLLWLHAVSVGETRAALPLVAALREAWPDHRLLVTQMTPTGRDAARELFGGDAAIGLAYLPYDYPWAVRRFLARFAPRAGLLMETEVWPNLVAACAGLRVPLLLVNGRLSARSAARMARAGRLARGAFSSLAGVGAQTVLDAARFASLGAPAPVVTGNLKFDLQPSPGLIEQGRAWRAGFARSRVLVAASTRDGEEALLFDALRGRPDARRLVVLVPRHPQRFDEVARLAAQAGLRVARRSATTRPGAEVDVWLGDSMGELPAYYASGDAAFVGGSLLPLGGQNLIEACACGVPVLLGPHTFNFAQAAEQAIDAGAARRVADADALVHAADAWLDDATRRRAAGEAGLRFAAAHRGATARTVALVGERLRGG